MAKNENKILDELRRRGKIYEDPAPKVGGFTGWLISLFTNKKYASYTFFLVFCHHLTFLYSYFAAEIKCITI